MNWLRHLLISCIACIVLAQAGSAASAVTAGEWSGATDDDLNVYLVVSGATVQEFLIEICVSGGSGGYGCFEELINSPLTIIGNSFSFSSSLFELAGTFTSSTTAQGTWSFHDGYMGYGNGTWVANFPAQPLLEFYPATRSFGEQEVGTAGNTSTFTLRNKGGGTAMGDVSLTGPDADQFEIVAGGGSFALTHDQSRDIQVRFTPTSTGEKTATLAVRADPPGIDLSATLTGTGTQPILSVTPDYRLVPERAGTATFSVRNTGPATNILAWSAEVDPADDWLTITNGSSGTNTGTISIGYAENSGEARIGTIVVTADGALNSPRTLYVLQAAGRSAKMTAADGQAGDFFGYSLRISGDYAVVGAYGDDDNGIDSGSAYVFERDGDGWIQEAKLTADDGQAGDAFGLSVAISGEYIIVGAYEDDDLGSGAGAAYIFARIGGTWIRQAKLTATDGAAGDHFGIAVGIDGEYAIIGAYADDDNGYNSGSAYVFRKGAAGWSGASQAAKLTASDGYGEYDLYVPLFDSFGCSVDMWGKYAIVGCCGTRHPGVYVFEQPVGGWSTMTETAKLTAAKTDYSLSIRNFGETVSISEEYAIVGADNSSMGANTQSGRAYIYKKPADGWSSMTQTAMLRAGDGGSGNGLKNGFGSAVSQSADSVLVGARFDDDNGARSGSAYVFKKPADGWVDVGGTDKFTASDGAPNDYLGRSASISGDYTLTGMPGDDDLGVDSGSVLAYWLGNFPPRISDIQDQVIYENQLPEVIHFTVSDSETLPEDLLIMVQSSNTALIPNDNIAVGGSAVARSVTITPVAGRTGTTTITVSVNDGGKTAVASFSFTVRPLSQAGDINGDGYISLEDVISGLKLMSGQAAGQVSVSGDINGDGIIGMEEVLFDLDDISEKK